MFTIEFEIIIVIILSAITCSIPGAFLVMRKNYYAADTTNRSAMLGIAIALIFSNFLSSPLVIILGSITAIIGMILVRKIKAITGFRAKGISIIISSIFLCLGMFISSNITFDKYTNFDTSIIYLGETAFTYFNRLRIAGVDIGSYALYTILIVMIINIVMVVLHYNEFKADGVDKQYAESIKMHESKIDKMLVIMTALSVSVSFQTAGIFMTTAFILGPAAAALYYTKNLYSLAVVSVLLSSVACIIGFAIAWPTEVSISGSIVSVIGILFIFSVIFAPEKGVFMKYLESLSVQKQLDEYILLDILNTNNIDNTKAVEQLALSLNWKNNRISFLINKLQTEKKIEEVDNKLQLTLEGKNILNTFMETQNCFY